MTVTSGDEDCEGVFLATVHENAAQMPAGVKAWVLTSSKGAEADVETL